MDEPMPAAPGPPQPALQPADERTALVERLDQYRAIATGSLAGLDHAVANDRLLPATDLTVAGIVKHLAWTEDLWFTVNLAGHPLPEPWSTVGRRAAHDFSFRAEEDDVGDVLALYAEACDRSRDVTAATQLDDLAAVESFGSRVNLRWVLVHMIDETARHAGHLDLLLDAARPTLTPP